MAVHLAIAVVIMTFEFTGARGGKLGRMYVPVAAPTGTGGMTRYCTMIESSIHGARTVSLAGYVAGPLRPVATVDELAGIAAQVNVETACRIGNEPSVYVVGNDGRTIYAVPSDVWLDRTSPFRDRVICFHAPTPQPLPLKSLVQTLHYLNQ